MRKTARLDQILIRLGYTDEDQIKRALARQRARGGRLGTCLVENRALTTKQLLAALSEQYQLPSVVPSAKDIPPELLRRIPRDLVFDNLILPLSWDQTRGSLRLAVGSPDDEAAIAKVKEIFGARAVRLELAPDSQLLDIGFHLLGSQESEEGADGGDLPDLVHMESGEDEVGTEGESAFEEVAVEVPKVLLVTGQGSRRHSLPPLFESEGFDLTVAENAQEASNALAVSEVSRVLVSDEMVGEFAEWIKERRIPEPHAEVVVFHSVSRALLENPLPYETVFRSLKAAVQALADARCAIHGSSPPYGLLASDLEALARRHNLRRVVVDGLQLAVHLLLPGPAGPGKDPVGSSQPFASFASSLELATRIRFPWRLDRVLDGCHALFSGRKAKAGVGSRGREMRLAAQLLALVWYRHNHLPSDNENPDEAMPALRAAIREKAVRLAPLEVVESYLRLIADRGGALAGGTNRQVLLVGGDRISAALTPPLNRVGCQGLFTKDPNDALTLVERQPPGALVIDHSAFPTQVELLARVAKLDSTALLFVLTDSTDPALVLKLLAMGVDDVFGPPHDVGVMAERVNRAIRGRARLRPPEKVDGGGFSAAFDGFSFVDLLEALGHGRKTVRLELSSGDGERGIIFLIKGQMVHASAGEDQGERAVYRIIAWEDPRKFTVKKEQDFPEPNIEASNEAIIKEGTRRLSRSRG